MCTNAPASGRQLVQAGAGHRISGQHHRRGPEFDPEPDGWCHRPVIGRGHPDRHSVAIPHRTFGVFVHFDGRRGLQIGVVSDPVTDVVAKRVQGRLNRVRGARRSDDRQRGGIRGERADPTRDEDVAEVADVIAVQVGEQQR